MKISGKKHQIRLLQCRDTGFKTTRFQCGPLFSHNMPIKPSKPLEGPEPYCVNIAWRTIWTHIWTPNRMKNIGFHREHFLFHRYHIRIDSAYSLYRVLRFSIQFVQSFASSTGGQIFSLYHKMHVLSTVFLFLLSIVNNSCGVCSCRNRFFQGCG
jgi:hypothetical protein